MTDRELLQQALDALKHLCLHSAAIKGYDGEQVQTAIDALKARLAQPENKFNPDWDAMAVMVEEQQRMAKRVEELEAQLAQPEPEPTKLINVNGVLEKAGYIKKKEWVGLTDEEIAEIGEIWLKGNRMLPFPLANAIEAKLKAKNEY